MGSRTSTSQLAELALKAHEDRERDRQQLANDTFLIRADKLRSLLERTLGITDAKIVKGANGSPHAEVDNLRFWRSTDSYNILFGLVVCRRCGRNHGRTETVTCLADLGALIATAIKQENSCQGR